MSVFSKIKDAIFGHPVAKAAAPATASASPTATSTRADEAIGSIASATPASASAKPAASTVDVAAVLDAAVKSKGQNLKWRTSIVDLMKALDLDSSLTARKELAEDFNYDGDMNDSATMNLWLHKQLMTELAESGGKVPDDLKA